jgi:phosphoserine aminotransferase
MTESNGRARKARRVLSFLSGPCAKPPGWGPEHLALGSLGRSHRSKLGKARLGHAIELTRKVLRVPATHRIGIVPAPTPARSRWRCGRCSAPAGDHARLGKLRRRLGHRRRQAAEARRDVLKAPYGELPDLAAVDPASDVVFTWNGTTSGVRVPDGDWIATPRGPHHLRRDLGRLRAGAPLGQARCRHLLLAEGAGRRGRPRRPDPRPARGRAAGKLHAAWPLPKIFRLTKGGKLIEGIFKGETINTPSMLAVEDYIFALEWAQGSAACRR